MLSDVETEEFIRIYVEIIWICVENFQEELPSKWSQEKVSRAVKKGKS